MTTYPVPAGQDGVTITVTAVDPAVIHWPYAIPAQVRVAATGGAVRFGFRGSAASGASGVTTVAAGQSATVNTAVEANPLILHVATSTATTATVTITGYREPGVLISAPIPSYGGGFGGGGSAPDATTNTKGIARVLGGTADAPTVPWASVTEKPAIPTGKLADASDLTQTGAVVGAVSAFRKKQDGTYELTPAVAADTIVYNARDHGVVGDWASAAAPGTNERAALQSLVNILGGLYATDGRPRHIYCPPGDYSVRDGGIVWKSGVSLIGAGPGLTRFHLANPGSPTNPTPLAAYTADFHGASTTAPLVDCTFAELEVDGSAVTLASYTTGPKAFVLQYILRGRFHNLYLHDCGATALGCDYLQDTIISNVVANGNGRLNNGNQPGGAGIGIGIGGWGAVERTTIIGCIAKGNGAHGIFVELQDNTFPPPKGLRIIGCHVESNRRGISDWGADGLIVDDCTIINNIAEGFSVCGDGVASIAGRGGEVTNCTISGNGTDGVLIGDTPGPYVVRDNPQISNNGRNGVRLGNTKQAAGYAQSGTVVDSNEITGNARAGIRVDGVVTDGFLLDNRVRANGTDTAQSDAARAGISIAAAMNSPTVRGNRSWDPQTTKKQTYGLAIDTGGSLGSATVRGNNLQGNLTGTYSSTPGVQSGGQWAGNSGIPVAQVTSPSTEVIDGPTYVNGALRYGAASRVWNSGALTPSATANTNGAIATCSPPATQLGLAALLMARAVFTGTFASETVTATFSATFSDNTTGTATVTATTAGTQVVASSGLLALAKDGCYIKKIDVAVKSTIASSAVSVAADVLAAQN